MIENAPAMPELTRYTNAHGETGYLTDYYRQRRYAIYQGTGPRGGKRWFVRGTGGRKETTYGNGGTTRKAAWVSAIRAIHAEPWTRHDGTPIPLEVAEAEAVRLNAGKSVYFLKEAVESANDSWVPMTVWAAGPVNGRIKWGAEIAYEIMTMERPGHAVGDAFFSILPANYTQTNLRRQQATCEEAMERGATEAESKEFYRWFIARTHGTVSEHARDYWDEWKKEQNDRAALEAAQLPAQEPEKPTPAENIGSHQESDALFMLIPDADGSVKIPNRAPRYTLEFDGPAVRPELPIPPLLCPDGTISGSATEILTGYVAELMEVTPTVDAGVISIALRGYAVRWRPVKGWEPLTEMRQLRANASYSVESAHYGDTEWSEVKNAEKAPANSVLRLVHVWKNEGAEAFVRDAVVMVEFSQSGKVIRLSPDVKPNYRGERWSAPQVSKYLKALLRKTFPGQKFSVRNDRGSAYGYLDIRWTGGPTESQVKEVCNPWQGSDFDGMADMMVQREPLLIIGDDGEPVEIHPVTGLFSYKRERPEGVKDGAMRIILQETGNPYGHSYMDPRPFKYQGEWFNARYAAEQLNMVMDAIEAGSITIPPADGK
ncbi:LPD29 domain-containing protein [Streptomyces xiamenensis]|uniref:LPD29 domain-containing protein n=1 Tax=Streptomyces xiamenensis TaxID=408015 RepID=UPI0035D8A5C4